MAGQNHERKLPMRAKRLAPKGAPRLVSAELEFMILSHHDSVIPRNREASPGCLHAWEHE
jgi:hypothetical protein